MPAPPKPPRPPPSLRPVGAPKASRGHQELALEETIEELSLEEVEFAKPRPGPGLTLVGTILADRYQILERIAEGGMGTVYVAEHITIGRSLAIKVLSPDLGNSPDIAQRFLQEARAASMIQHEHIVDIIDFGYTDQGQAFLAMELLDGEDLATTLAHEGRLPWTRLRRMLLQICRALNAAHEKGVIHRDMKPDNCFRIKRGGNPDFIKLLDFGIAKVMTEATTVRGKRPVAQSATAAGTLLGTPEYMAPELARDAVADARVDIYSLGVMMYELLTGAVPFRGETFMSTLAMHLTQEPVPPRRAAPSADIPPAIEAVILRALAKDPADRFQDIREMTEALVAADERLRSTGLFLQAIPDTPADEATPAPRSDVPIDRSPTLSAPHQAAAAARQTPPGRVATPGILSTGRYAAVPAAAPAPAPASVATGSHRALNPSLLESEITEPTAPAPAPEFAADPLGPALEEIRPNPYRWLSALLAVIVFGMGVIVWQNTRPPAENGDAAEKARAQTTASGTELAAAGPTPTTLGAADPKGATPGESPGESASDDDEPPNTDPRMGTLRPITDDELRGITHDLQEYVQRCAKSYGIRAQDQPKVNISLRIKAGTGKISADLPSDLFGETFGTCITEAVNNTQFEPGRKAIRFNHYFGP